MKANELRIGNLFKDRGGKVLRLDFWDHMVPAQRVFIEGSEMHPLTEYLDYCQPVPLTEEWLLRFGFELRAAGSEFVGHNMILHNWLVDREYVSWGTVKLKYVHQLQNLYFALTGEELIIQADR